MKNNQKTVATADAPSTRSAMIDASGAMPDF